MRTDITLAISDAATYAPPATINAMTARSVNCAGTVASKGSTKPRGPARRVALRMPSG